MNRGGVNSSSDPAIIIPMDLITEILSRLPAKSVARFRCVSKPWKSIICRHDFIRLFHTKSSSTPRLLIVVQPVGRVGRRKSSLLIPPHHMRSKFRFYSSPQNHYDEKSSSLVVSADFHTKFVADSQYYLSYASGLFYFTKLVHEDGKDDAMRVICNPSTGQYAILPPVDDLIRTTYRLTSCGLLGFDPIGKQFKVLIFRVINETRVYHILTLGTENMRWREIKCPSTDDPGEDCDGICINGILYYHIVAFDTIGCFDVRYEKFKFLRADHDVLKCFKGLINYKGKFCGFNLAYGHDGGFPIKLRMWVLQDVDKGEWSTYAYTLNYAPADHHQDYNKASSSVVKVDYDLFVVGVTEASGEIVLAKDRAEKPFYVFYFNPETNTLRSFEIQGIREEEIFHQLYCFIDYVEDLNFDVMKTTTYDHATTYSTTLMRSSSKTRKKKNFVEEEE